MKRALTSAFAGTALIALTACGGAEQNVVPFDANRMAYDIDDRTGICFAATGITETNAVGAGWKFDMEADPVPCTEGVLKQIAPEKRDSLRARGLSPVVY